jgi:hypothetical protein
VSWALPVTICRAVVPNRRAGQRHDAGQHDGGVGGQPQAAVVRQQPLRCDVQPGSDLGQGAEVGRDGVRLDLTRPHDQW